MHEYVVVDGKGIRNRHHKADRLLAALAKMLDAGDDLHRWATALADFDVDLERSFSPDR